MEQNKEERLMKKFMAIYTGTPESHEKSQWNKLTEGERDARVKEGITAWMEWGRKNAAVIIDQGSPLGKTKCTNANGISDTKNNMTGYVILQAETHEAAAALFKSHPHFTIFPGDSVEIMECLPLPDCN
jgi:hypothetical protein